MSRRAITRATVFNGDRFLPDTTLIWADGLVEFIGGNDDLDPSDVEVVGSGGTVVPGLIDAHVHLCLDGTLERIEGVASEPSADTLARSRSNAALQLAAGATTVRDMGSRDAVAVQVSTEQAGGSVPGPLIIAAGRGITPTGGHGWMIGVIADGPEAVAAATAAEIDNGATAVKLFPTGGILGSGSHGPEVMMSAADVAAAVRVAHRAGVQVGAHVVGEAGIDVVLDGGVDTIEHAVGLTREQAARCADTNTALVPTLTAVEMMRRHAESLPPDLVERVEEAANRHARGIKIAIEQGVTVLAGTDAGTPFNPHGGLVTEMELLQQLGAGIEGALSAATAASADRLGLIGRGRIAVGAIADLMWVDADLRLGLDGLRTPKMVMQAGDIRISP